MTEVVHGLDPKFKLVEIVPGSEYGLTMVGYYTTTDNWTAGGVTASTYKSEQGKKRRNELLGMRSIFFDWWVAEWVRQEGEFDEGVRHLAQYPHRRPG